MNGKRGLTKPLTDNYLMHVGYWHSLSRPHQVLNAELQQSIALVISFGFSCMIEH
jgi:hypothetical protein